MGCRRCEYATKIEQLRVKRRPSGTEVWSAEEQDGFCTLINVGTIAGAITTGADECLGDEGSENIAATQSEHQTCFITIPPRLCARKITGRDCDYGIVSVAAVTQMAASTHLRFRSQPLQIL